MELYVQEKAEFVLSAYEKPIASGDWRASASLLERIYGRPRERVEMKIPETPEEVEQLSLGQVQELRRRLEGGRLELVEGDG